MDCRCSGVGIACFEPSAGISADHETQQDSQSNVRQVGQETGTPSSLTHSISISLCPFDSLFLPADQLQIDLRDARQNLQTQDTEEDTHMAKGSLLLSCFPFCRAKEPRCMPTVPLLPQPVLLFVPCLSQQHSSELS